MAWLLTLILGLLLLHRPAAALGPDSTQYSKQNNLSSKTIIGFQQTLPTSRHGGWNEERVDNTLYKDWLLPLRPNFGITEGSGDGSGLQQSFEEITPSTGLLEMNMLISDRAEKQDFEEGETNSPPAPPIAQKQTQNIVNNDDQDMILANNRRGLSEATSTMPVQLETLTHTTAFINNNEKVNKDLLWMTTTTPVREKITTINSTQVNMFLETFTSSENVDHSTSLDDVVSRPDVKTSSSTQNLSSITKPEMSIHNDAIVRQFDPTLRSSDILTVGEEHYVTKHAPAATPKLQMGEEATSTTHISMDSTSTAPSVLQGTNRTTDRNNTKMQGGNVTQLQWVDLKRTLVFAWELHVFGSAFLFLLVMVAATFGVISGADTLHPFCEALTLANILLLLAGLLRFLHFIIDPYGTRNILPRPAFAGLYNLPIPLLLWAQATLALLALKEERLSLVPTSIQRLSVTGLLAALHCTSLLMADLLSKALSPALPLMLQTLTISWGLPLCLGVLFNSLKHIYSSHGTPIPRWNAPKRIENNVRRVLSMCAFLGVLSCTLHIYGFLWLYGLFGDWRRFGWGWWLGQLWARLLELAWSFSLLLLGSRAFWKPKGIKRRAEHSKQTASTAGAGKLMSHWNRLLERLPIGLWRRPDRNWAELLPNNWAGYKQSKANVSQSVIQNQGTPATVVTTMQDNSGIIDGGVVYSSSYDRHVNPLWSSGVEWQEHECFLSLIEFDLHPPSPINLGHCIDSALHHAHLLGVGTLFTPSSSSWTQNEGSTLHVGGNTTSSTTPPYRAYRWALDSDSSQLSNQHFGAVVEQTQVSVIEPLVSLTPETIRKVWERNSAIPRVNEDDDWTSIGSGDDITSL